MKLSKSEIIIKEVCDYYDVSREQLLSKRRPEFIAWPRQVAMFVCRQLLPNGQRGTLEEVGRKFKRDHGTVMHAVKKVNFCMETYPATKAEVEAVWSKAHQAVERDCE